MSTMHEKLVDYNSEIIMVKDTKNLQLASLDLFAQALGYYRVNGKNSYLKNTLGKTELLHVSLGTMQKWHNNNFCYTVGNPFFMGGRPRYYPETKHFELDDMVKAVKAKLVNRTKLQVVKKTKEILVVDHVIELA